MRKKRGHDVGPWWQVGRFWINCCPQRYVTLMHLRLLEIWRMIQAGHLPYSGGWLEQPAGLIIMVQALTGVEREIEAARRDSGSN